MKKAITSFSPHKTALTVSLVFAISSLFFLLPFMIMSSFMPVTDQDGNPVNANFPFTFIIAMPFMYLVMGYIFTAIGAWLYNQVSKFTGGIQYTTNDASKTE